MVILSFFFIFLGLVYRNLQLAKILFYDWDEAMYAQIAQEILKNKSLFTTFNDQVWLDKPPLVHTLIAIVFATVGRSEFWSRMIMVGIACILLILTYKLSKKIYCALVPNVEKKELAIVGLIPTLFLAATPIFMERSTLVNSDTLIAVSWMGYLLYRERFWAKFFFLTLGVWTKSVLGFYPLVFDAIAWLITKDKIKKIFNRSMLWKLPLVLVVPSLWYIAGYLKFGNAFIYHHFISQVFKRISVPIELHFGDKFYYLTFIWQQLGFITLIFIANYLIYVLDFLSGLIKKGGRFFTANNLLVFLLMTAPLPFFTILTFMKTKIYWYVIMFFPFVCVSLLYLYASLKQIFLRRIFFAAVILYFLVSFIPQTFLAKTTYIQPDRLKLAQCIASKPYDNIAFLVDEDERKIKNVLEAAHYNTTSSFYYGGSPSFVYYVQKKVTYFYSTDEFIQNHGKYSILVASMNDMELVNDVKQIFSKHSNKLLCTAGSWVAVVQ